MRRYKVESDDKKGDIITIRVSPKEKELIQAKADKANMKLSTYVRASSLNKTIKEKPDKEFYNSIRDLRKIEFELKKLNKKQLYPDKDKALQLANDIQKMIYECKEVYS